MGATRTKGNNMKKVFSLIGLMSAVLFISLTALAGDQPANIGHPEAAINNSLNACFWDVDYGVRSQCTNVPLSYNTWDVPMGLATGTYSVYANVYVTGVGGTQAMRCRVKSYSYQGVVVSAPATVLVPNTAAGYQTVLLGSVSVPLNGYAVASCDFSQAGQYWTSTTW